MESWKDGPARAVRLGIEFALAQGLAVDGIKVLAVTGGQACAPADENPVMTTEYLGELGVGRWEMRGHLGCASCWVSGHTLFFLNYGGDPPIVLLPIHEHGHFACDWQPIALCLWDP